MMKLFMLGGRACAVGVHTAAAITPYGAHPTALFGRCWWQWAPTLRFNDNTWIVCGKYRRPGERHVQFKWLCFSLSLSIGGCL